MTEMDSVEPTAEPNADVAVAEDDATVEVKEDETTTEEDDGV